MVQRAGQPRLAQETMRELTGVRVEARELLERDLTVEVWLPSGINDRHSSAPDFAEDLVPADHSNLGAHPSQDVGGRRNLPDRQDGELSLSQGAAAGRLGVMPRGNGG